MAESDMMKMIGEAILLASIQFSIGSVEMSSKFSVRNFSKDQETLQNAADALSDYMKIGLLWTVGTVMVLYSSFGCYGGIAALIANLVILIWVYGSYITAFKDAAGKYKLNMPVIKLL
jgi:hypothetical protein